MPQIPQNLAAVVERLERAARAAGRIPSEVGLVAVSKTFSVDEVRAAYDAGHRVFGESRLQEALPKIEALPEAIDWHFIGRVQRNKLRKILASFRVIHGIDSLALAEAADRMACELGLHPQIFLQVNLAGEESKGGFSPDELRTVMPRLRELERVEILGLMTIPPPSESEGEARSWFAALKSLRDRMEDDFGIRLPGLSMGMSDDFEVAIGEGATHVRVGSAIFGSR